MSANKLYSKITRGFGRGDTLFQEGDVWDGMYCIQKGKVGVFKSQPNGEADKVELAQLGVGALLGELGIFEPARRDATVVALEDTEVLVVTRAMFEEQLKALPPWVGGVVKVLSARLRNANARHLELLRPSEPQPDVAA